MTLPALTLTSPAGGVADQIVRIRKLLRQEALRQQTVRQLAAGQLDGLICVLDMCQ